jgi:uncharacterized protein YegP (UPF0339 family)
MSEFAPVVYVDVYETRPPRYRGKARRQPWRWNARNANNNEIMASGEAYTNEADALAAVEQLFGSGTNVYLRQHERGNQVLRMAQQ